MAEAPSPPHTPPPSPQLTPPSAHEVNPDNQTASRHEFRYILRLIHRAMLDDDYGVEVDSVFEDIVEDELDSGTRQRREYVMRFRVHDVATQAIRRGHFVLARVEILMDIGDDIVEIRYQDPRDGNGNINNSADYAHAAAMEELFRDVEEIFNGREIQAPPPAARSAIEGLPSVEVKSSSVEVCVVCKDKLLNIENQKIVKRLPCGHMYHEECIVPWLDLRNTCPVCRFELDTDDPEYEKRRKRARDVATTSSGDRADDTN